jgi:hypothetical protein
MTRDHMFYCPRFVPLSIHIHLFRLFSLLSVFSFSFSFIFFLCKLFSPLSLQPQPPAMFDYIDLAFQSATTLSLSLSMANHFSLCLIGAMDRLWFHQIILFSEPISQLSLSSPPFPDDEISSAMSSVLLPDEEISLSSSPSSSPLVTKTRHYLIYIIIVDVN